jgi:hypothetical protein
MLYFNQDIPIRSEHVEDDIFACDTKLIIRVVWFGVFLFSEEDVKQAFAVGPHDPYPWIVHGREIFDAVQEQYQ